MDEFVRHMNRGFQQYAADEERLRRERARARHVLHKEAWQREKDEAKVNKSRYSRMMHKTKHARDTRHVHLLKNFWQSHRGVLWQDVVIGCVLLSCTWTAALEIGKVFPGGPQ